MAASLPTEILVEIFRLVPVASLSLEATALPPAADDVRNARKTLYSLCLCSKRFAHLAQPLLYSEFSLGYVADIPSTPEEYYVSEFEDNHDVSDRVPPQPLWEGRLLAFVRTLLARPDLAALERRAFIHPALITSMSRAEVIASILQLSRALGHPGLETCSKFIDHVPNVYYDRGPDLPPSARPSDQWSARQSDQWPTRPPDFCDDEEYLRFLVYGLMPNLEHAAIRCSTDGTGSDPWYSPWWRSREHQIWNLPKLTSVELIYRYDLSAFAVIPDMFPGTVQQVKTLTIRGAPVPSFDEHTISHFRCITDLRIFDDTCDFEGLYVGLCHWKDRLIPRLESFYYHLAPDRAGHYSQRFMYLLDYLGMGGHYSSPSLRHLYLDLRGLPPQERRDGTPVIRPLGSMEGISNLESLVISANMLYCDEDQWTEYFDLSEAYSDVFPRSLRSLRVLGWSRAVTDEGLGHLLEIIRFGDLPHLKEVMVSEKKESTRNLKDLKRQFAEVGVVFRVVDDPPHPPEITHWAGEKKAERYSEGAKDRLLHLYKRWGGVE